MADEEVKEETEEAPDEDLEAIFAGTDEKAKTEEKPEEGKAAAEEEAETVEEEPEETAQDILEREAKEAAARSEPPAETGRSPGGQPPKKQPQETIQDVDVKELESIFKTLPKKVKFGEEELDVEDYIASFPDDARAALLIAKAAFDKMMSESDLVKLNDVKAALEQRDRVLDDILFWQEVANQSNYPKPLQIANSKEFIEWRDAQPEHIQRLAKSVETPDQVIKLLDAFHEAKAKKTADTHDKAKAEKKKEKDDLLKHTTGRKKQMVSPEDAERDAIAAFEAYQ